MSIDYQDQGMKEPAECLLSAIDFDAEILTLTPLNDFYLIREFQANLKYCSVSKRLKAAAIEGENVKDIATNKMKAKKIGIYIEEQNECDTAS